MADTPIERRNPLVDRLNAVAELNAEMGTALGGGARPPRGPVEGGRATVLPPPPRPVEGLDEVSQQELADLEAAWANDPSNPSNQAAHVRTLPPARELQSQPTVQGIALPVAATGTGFGLVTHIEVGTGTLITSTGRRLQLVPEEVLEVKRFVFTAALQAIVRETNNQLEELRISLGLPKIEPPKETLTEALNGDQAVQPVQGNEAPGSVLQVRPGRRRKASVLPPV